MRATRWVRVTAGNPCPVCRRGDWCRVTADGAVAGCMRVETGCFRVKDGRDGTKVYLHRLAESVRPEADPPPRPGPEAKRADAETLHAVYSALLAALALGKAHREALRHRGLSDEAMDRAGYRTLPGQGRTRLVRALRERFGDNLLRVPGFVVKEGRSGRYLTLRGPAGLIVPCRDRIGRVVALKVRRDDAGEDRSRYCYVSSAGHGGPGPGAPPHCPAGMPEAADVARLTEGELKADVVQALTGLPTVSVPGVGSWRPALGVLQGLGCKVVRLAFDADAWINPTVARAQAHCASALVEAGFLVELELWDAAEAKGLDDLLASGKTPKVISGDQVESTIHDMHAAATADEALPPPDELARLHEVLEAGGAEALFRDAPLMQALAELAGSDPAGFAAVRASIRQRVSLRDLDKALRAFRRPTAPGEAEDVPVYFEDSGCTYRHVLTKEGPVPVALCNFTARIVEDVEHDDGAEKVRHLVVQGVLADGSALPRAEVPAGNFVRMDWIVPAWGTRAVVNAGMGTRDHLRAALQLLSGDVPRRTVYGHLGWRKIDDAWLYLHVGGAIGGAGAVEGIPVLLPESLNGFDLPPPPEGSALVAAVRASLGLLGLGPGRVTFPLLAAVYRAALGETDFALHFAGPTGSFKSEAAALAQQHFGPGMDARHLPANWSSTGNALEGLAFTAKDALLVVDDFCPTGSANDVQRYHKEADRLFRGQGNRSGRLRMRADATLRPARPPRGLTLSTGEDTPRGQSLRARLLVVEISVGDFGPRPPASNPVLSKCQKDAAAGLYAQALAGFLSWLAPRLDGIRNRLRAELAELRDRARRDGQHARTPGIVADLALGLRYLLDFARSADAISEVERGGIEKRGWSALAEAAEAQGEQLVSAEPAGLFLRLLTAAVAGGHAHLAGKDGHEPPDPVRWGWRPEEYYAGDGIATRYKAQGARVGWLADSEVYLEPDASFAAVQRFARDQNESFAITAPTLRRRLKEKGLLATTDATRGKLTVRRTLQGARRDVLHIAWEVPPSAPKTGPEGGADVEGGPERWAGSRTGNGQGSDDAAHKAAGPCTPGHSPAPAGPGLGRWGRLGAGEEATAGTNNFKEQADGWGDWQ